MVHGMPPAGNVPLGSTKQHDSVRRDDVDEHLLLSFNPKLVQIALVVVLNGIQGSNREVDGLLNWWRLTFHSNA